MRAPVLVLLSASLLLGGCAELISAYNDKFECPREGSDCPCEQASKSYARNMEKHALPAPPDPGRYTQPLTETEWTPPIKTVWFSPYVDSFGRRHEAAIVRITVMPGKPSVKPEPEYLVPPVPETADDGSTIGPPVPPAEGTPVKQPQSPFNRTQRAPSNSVFQRSQGVQGMPNFPNQPAQPQPGGFSIPGY